MSTPYPSLGVSIMDESLLEEIKQVLVSQNGVIFASPAQVCRAMYSGRGIIAPNMEFSSSFVDSRGYLPVEWWIMSKTHAKNAIPIKNEGITSLLINGRQILLTDALRVAEKELMGGFSSQWPLTKVLDIGGTERAPKYTSPDATNGTIATSEAPPIPCHVHAGDVVSGRCVGHGKTEAYFFPPLDVPPYNLQIGAVKTRLGLRPGVTKEQVLAGIKQFGKSDDLYSLLNEFTIKPWESWTIEEKIIHAPGPWLTFEIQLPQDDFNLLAWVLGQQVSQEDMQDCKDSYHLRGLANEEDLFKETIDWISNTDPEFRGRWWNKCEVLSAGEWGRVVRLFYHMFYGEGVVIRPEHKYQRQPDAKPYAGIVWSGDGSVNGLKLNSKEQLQKEFLVTPNSPLELVNTSLENELIVFTVFPLLQNS